MVAISADPAVAVEGEPTGVVFHITQTGESELDTTVTFKLDLGELEPEDIESITLTNTDGTTATYTVAEVLAGIEVKIPAGTAAADMPKVTVVPVDDDIYEVSEAFTGEISAPVNATLGTPTADGSFVDEDDNNPDTPDDPKDGDKPVIKIAVSEEGLLGGHDAPMSAEDVDTTNETQGSQTIKIASPITNIAGPALMANGLAVSWGAYDATSGTLLGSTTEGSVIKVTVGAYDAVTGETTITVDLLDSVDHPVTTSEDVLDLVFQISAGSLTFDMTVSVEDDSPMANADTDTVAAAQMTPATGNVLTGVDATGGDANTTDGVADVPGADGPVTVSAVVATTAGGTEQTVSAGTATVVTGSHGVLTLNADGSYSYQPNAPVATEQKDVFTYTIKDSDGDTAETTLTITLEPAGAPSITDLTPKADGGDTLVKEEALADGSNPTSTEEKGTGTFTVKAPAGVDSVTIGGVTVIDNGALVANAKVTTPLGNELVVTGYNATTGEVTYEYTLLDNEQHAAVQGKNDDLFDDLAVVVTDNSTQTATGTLSVKIVDDVPMANADTDTVAAAQMTPATGNVLTGVDATGGDANTTDGVADVPGADGPVTVSAVVATTAGGTEQTVSAGTATVVTGSHGVLTLNADGSYSYQPNAPVATEQKDVFTYTIKDSDGDTAETTLTITLEPAGAPSITDLTPKADGGDTLVKEEALADGSNPTSTEEKGTGTFTVKAPAGVDSVTIGGVTVIDNGALVANAKVTTPLGNELVVTGYNATTGEVTYEYTLLDNEQHAAVQGKNDDLFDDLAVVVTDNSTQTATGTLSVKIVDDVPMANADTDTVVWGTPNATGNVITGTDIATGGDTNTTDGVADVPGADGGLKVVTVAATTAGGAETPVSATTATSIQGQHGVLVINADGSYSYIPSATPTADATDVFTYTIRDADGDTSSTTLTITLEGPPQPPVITSITSASVSEEGLPGGLPSDNSGTVDTTDAVVATGLIKFTDVDSVAGDFTFNLTKPAAAVTSNGVTVLWNTDTANTIIGTINGVEVIKVVVAAATVDATVTNGFQAVYTVTLSGPLDHKNTTIEDVLGLGFGVTIKDGSMAPASNNMQLLVNVEDDSPVANNDATTILENDESANGNVLTADKTNATIGDASVADQAGADGHMTVVSYSQGATTVDAGIALTGTYGALTIDKNGNYNYVITNDDVHTWGDARSETEVFTYTIRDADGDTKTATLTVTVKGETEKNPVVVVPNINGLESGDYSIAENLNDGFSKFYVTVPTGEVLASLTFAGQTLTAVDLAALSATNPQKFVTPRGELNLIGYKDGTVTYTYNPAGDHQDHRAGDLIDTFPIFATTVAGAKSPSVNLDVNITDTVPQAVADTHMGSLVSGIISSNVIVGGGSVKADLASADGGLKVVGVTHGNTGVPLNDTTTLGKDLEGTYGKLTMAADGKYTYTVNPDIDPGLGASETVKDVFTYTIADADGSMSQTTLTTLWGGKNDVPVTKPLFGTGKEAGGYNNLGLDPLNPIDSHDGFPATGNFLSTTTDADTTAKLSLVSLVSGIISAPGLAATKNADGSWTLNDWQGILTVKPNGDYTFTPAALWEYLQDGETAKVQYHFIVEDEHKATSGKTPLEITIQGTNDAPVPKPDAKYLLEGGSVKVAKEAGVILSPYGEDTDIDNPQTALYVTRVWQGTDNTTAVNAGAQIQGKYGVLTLAADGGYTYTSNSDAPVAGAILDDVFTYEVSDGKLTNTTTLTMKVEGINDAPTANHDIIPVAEDAQAAPLDLLKNDTDPDNVGTGGVSQPDTLRVATVNGVLIEKGKAIDVRVEHGTVHVAADGKITFTPDANWNGTFSFPYQVEDTQGALSEATVTVEVTSVNDAPIANIDNQTVYEGGTLDRYKVTSNDYDVEDGTNLTVTGVVAGTASPGTAGVGQTLTGKYGTLTLQADGSYVYKANANIANLEAGASVVDTFTYQVKDTEGALSNETTLNITVVGTATGTPPGGGSGDPQDPGQPSPGLTLKADTFVTNEDESKLFDPLGNDSTSTADGTLSVSHINGVQLQPGVATTIAVPNGKVQVAADGKLTFVPDPDWNGSTTFSYMATDGKGAYASSTVTFDVAPVNDAPVARDDYLLLNENTSKTLAAASGVILGSAGRDHDPEGEALTVVSVKNADGQSATAGTALVGTWGTLTLNADGGYTYESTSKSIPAGTSEYDTFTYTVRDASGATSTATLKVEVVGMNDDPVLIGTPTATLVEDAGTSATFKIADMFKDPDTGDQLHFMEVSGNLIGTGSTTLNLAEGKLVLDPVTGTMTFTPKENYYGDVVIPVTVSDGKGGAATANVTVKVEPVNDAPGISGTPTSVAENLAGAATLNSVKLTMWAQDRADRPDAGTGLWPSPETQNYTATVSVTNGTLSYNYTPPASGHVDSAGNLILAATPVLSADGRTLKLTGAEMSIQEFLNTSGNLRYTPDVGFYGTEKVQMSINDGGNIGSGGAKTTTAQFDITVTHLNVLPSLAYVPSSDPARVLYPEFTRVDLLKDALVTGAQIQDSDQSANGIFSLRLGVDGTGYFDVDVGTGTNLTKSGTNTNLTLTGTLSEINEFLAGGNGNYAYYQDAISSSNWNNRSPDASISFHLTDEAKAQANFYYYTSFPDTAGSNSYQDGNKYFAGQGGVAGAPGVLTGTAADEHFFGSVVTTSAYTGDNTLTGGGGNDRFWYDRSKGNGKDVITDFLAGDKLVFLGVSSADALAANGGATWNDNTKTLSFNSSVGAMTSEIHLQGYTGTYASAVDFLRANAEFHTTMPVLV